MPFQVESEGKSLNNNTEHFCVIPSAGGREHVLEIRYGNGEMPSQRFNIWVQKNAAYGFQLAKSADGHFYLLDLVNEGKVLEAGASSGLTTFTEKNQLYIGNTKAVNGVKAAIPVVNEIKKESPSKPVVVNKTTGGDSIPKRRAPEQYKKNKILLADTTQAVVQKETEKGVPVPPPVKVELNQNVSTKETTALGIDSVATTGESSYEIQGLTAILKPMSDDEARMHYLRSEWKGEAGSPSDVLSLGKLFETQYGRLTFCRWAIKQSKNPVELDVLNELFLYAEYREKFSKLLNNPNP